MTAPEDSTIKGSFQDNLALFNLTDGNLDNDPVTDIYPSRTVFVPVSVYWPCATDGVVYNGIFKFLYYSKLHKFGSSAK